MSVRAKFVCNSVDPEPATPGAARQIQLGVVYSGSPENVAFFQASPGGSISLFCTNAEATKQFVMGKEYYVDFTPAEEVPQTAAEPTPVPTPPAAA